MERPVARPPERAVLAEPTSHERLSVTVSEVRWIELWPPAVPRATAPEGAFHPRAFLEALLPPDYYLG